MTKIEEHLERAKRDLRAHAERFPAEGSEPVWLDNDPEIWGQTFDKLRAQVERLGYAKSHTADQG